MPWRNYSTGPGNGPYHAMDAGVIQTLPVARQTYIVQVRLGPQSIVIGVVQPEAVMAVKVRIKPRTTLYFRPDMTTPSVGEI